ncbi:MAG: MYXO-CTERM sorting domain-containing protein [Bradymonadaceae bacterium]
MPTTAHAEDPATILVAPVAPTRATQAFEFVPGDSPSVRRKRDRPLMPSAIAPLAVAGLEVLPDGRFLLAGLAERGAAITRGGAGLDFELGGVGSGRGIGAVAAAGYGQKGDLVRIAMAENGEQRVSIYDRRFDQRIWSQRLVTPPTRARVTQLVALPDHRLAAAVQWPRSGAAGVDIFELDEGDERQPTVRFADRRYTNAPDDLIVDDRLSTVRDVFGLGAKTLLVTTPQRLLRLSLEDESISTIVDIDDLRASNGEFVAARQFDSGRLVAATVEPGLWTRSHPNHRILWIDPAQARVLTRSPPLANAPWRVDRAAGHGGSGTAGFSPGLDYLPTSNAEAARLQGAIEVRPTPLEPGKSGRTAAQVVNIGNYPLPLTSISIFARPGACEAKTDREVVLVERLNVSIRSRRGKWVRSSFQLAPDVPTGSWCALARVEAADGTKATLEQTTEFRVVPSNADAGPNPADAGGGDAGPGRDTDATADSGTPPTDPNRPATDRSSGCACSSGEGTPAAPWMVLAAGWLVLVRRRRQGG